MCGIFGIVKKEEDNLGEILIGAAERLTYRGYDSVGMATTLDGAIDLRKDVGKVDAVAAKYNVGEMRGQRGITQLRWATFGAPSQINAQPHLDSDGNMVGAHNGNVVNNIELRQQFIAEGLTVRSENDGESCVHAVERYMKKGYEIIDAMRLAYGDLKGDYAFVLAPTDSDKLYALKKGSGLVVGIGEDFTCLSSDLPSLLPLTREILRPQDGEIIILSHNSVELRSITDGSFIERDPETITESMDAVQKGGYPHFMLKEIHEQPQVARELHNLLDDSPDIDEIIEKMRNARNLYLVACGTSYHASLAGSVSFAQLAGRTAIPVLAPQFMPQYAPTVNHDDVGIFVSQSGETKDVLNALAAAEAKGMTPYGIANVIGSTLTQFTNSCLPLGCGYEISVPATKTFTNQVYNFIYLAYKLAGKNTDALKSVPELMEKTLEMVAEQVADLASTLDDVQDMYTLGYGATLPIALEGALKLKEITYAHCEGMLSTEFKHGPLSAVTENYPIIFVAGPNDIPLIISGINEVTTRGARAIVIGPDDERLRANATEMIIIPDAPEEISALLAVLPLQLLSYHMSVARGYDPDFPRNLSKTLTVD